MNLPAVKLLAALVLTTASCGPSEGDRAPANEPAAEAGSSPEVHAMAGHDDPNGETNPSVSITQPDDVQAPRPPMTADEIQLSGTETAEDWTILLEKIYWARAERLDEAPMGEAVARIGETFVGKPYTPGTLEVDGPEALVVNLREFDCVTFVEASLALARVVQTTPRDQTDPEVLRDRFIEQLAHLRYRHGVIDGYPSRLHYFSDWIADNQRRGVVLSIGHLMGGTEVADPINFMSTHPDAYRQLSDPDNLELIREIEARLSSTPLYPIRENRVGQFVDEIETGDVIAATSTVDGLDIAHTGIALWQDGTLHLMHAPLVGKTVEISDLPLADRLMRIDGQDGILVARPLEVQ